MPNSKLPGVVRIIDYLGKKAPQVAMKHPGLLAGGIGLTLGLRGAMKPANVMEAAMLRERMGAPGAKFAELNEFEERKEDAMVMRKMAEATGQMKVAYDIAGGNDQSGGLGGQLMNNATKEVGKAGIGALAKALTLAGSRVYDKVSRDPQRQQVFQKVTAADPYISQFMRESPENKQRITEAFQSMSRFAPVLSTDPNAVTSLLRQVSVSAGPVDYNLIKSLADAEASIRRIG